MTIDTSYFITPERGSRQDRLFVYCEHNLIVRGNNLTWSIDEIENLLEISYSPLLIATVDNIRYLALHLEIDESSSLPAESVSLRSLLLESGPGEFRVPGLGNQLINWYKSHRYCGSCGGATHPHDSERAMVCGNCQLSFYPRINPCVIVLVIRDDKMLLAKHARFKGGFYSCLAGFMEAGETPEETVAREVKEEVGIEVSNIRYIKSQSWPFPSQLMLGFFADYKSGELRPDQHEIEEAAWFDPSELPAAPSPKISVAGELIELFRKQSLAR